ncbi:MAG: class I SAM-dependent methyltransferase [Pseudomonadota bacterium]|nr:class I SAM-dependent methyltransferase [Pseudomonadota bacterium]
MRSLDRPLQGPHIEQMRQDFYEALERRAIEGKPTKALDSQERELCNKMLADYAEALKTLYQIDVHSGIDRPQWLDVPLKDWMEFTPYQRHLAVEDARTVYLGHIWRNHWDLIPAGKCLDMGCGTGMFLDLMQTNDTKHEWHGIELDNLSLPSDHIRKKIPRYQIYRGKQLPYEDKEFTGITLHNVLHHVKPEMRKAFLNEIYRVTKPGAHIIVTEEMAHGLQRKDYPEQFVREGGSHILDQALQKLDGCFYPNSERGYQQSAPDWQKELDEAGFSPAFAGCCGTYNVAGIPIGENYMVFTRREDSKKHDREERFFFDRNAYSV